MSAYQVQTDPTKVMGRRIGAWVIDVLILLAIGFGLSLFFLDATTADFNPCPDPVSGETQFQVCTVDEGIVLWDGDRAAIYEVGSTALINGISLVINLAIFVVWQGLSGMTPGKALTGIRTVGHDGRAPGIGRALVRWLLWIVDAFPYCCFVPLVGGITAFASKGHRRVGDMVANTLVVSKDAMGTPVAVPGLTPPAQPGTTPAPPMTMAPAPVTTATQPQWDPQRNAYIQWDPERQVWLQHDPEHGWFSIS